ncbi:MAG TPA: non-canonical purine NTP pyrophosphatase [Gaiellaceae bacterium]
MELVRAVLCSQNPHKARELERLLPGWTIEPLEVDDYPPEDGDTYYANARAKALYGRDVGDASRWMIGEDSGIEVEALDGGPGIASARFAAGDPVGRLLRELEGVEGDGRRARFVSDLVALSPAGAELRGRGTLDGRIAPEASGDEGFGYDPIFIPVGEERTVAELGDDWKERYSHRARAAEALLKALAGSAG